MFTGKNKWDSSYSWFANRKGLPVRCFLYLSCFIHYFSSCTTVDLYEKSVAIPKHRWSSSFKPEFHFTIKDSVPAYQLFFVLRHNEKYGFNNIWINLYSQPPGDTMHKATYELQLATNEGWLASGMDDIYEHRLKLTDEIRLKTTGEYRFIIENIMREDPLLHVMNVGLRLEKKQ